LSARIRTGYSFRQAAGKIDDVIAKLLECNFKNAPITDVASTFGFVPWSKSCAKAGLKPIYGAELAISASPNETKPIFDHCTFLAIGDIAPVNRLVNMATNQFRYQPLLSVDQFNNAKDVIKIVGRRLPLDQIKRDENTYLALSPSVNPGYVREALRKGFGLIACSDNRYVDKSDFSFYETLVGRNAGSQTYPQHILSDDEWLTWMVDDLEISTDICQAALRLRDRVLDSCHATLAKGSLVTPHKPKTLEELCIEGAVKLGVNFAEKPNGAAETYRQRLDRELALIEEKQFTDYFHILADMVSWARERMTVGPGRGSGCGSLVCYLTGITTVDPLVHDLMLERFISVDRSDLPDLDIDFPPTKRDLVFEYLDRVYGAERVGRLGSVGLFKADSALNETCGALKIPLNDSIPVKESVEKYVMNDARGLVALNDALQNTSQGKAFLRKYPEARIATQLEGHPRYAGTHAAGILISDKPLVNYTATDYRIGTAMLDKGMAEDLGLLKIDVLGVKQLDVFESCLRMLSLPHDYMDKVTLDNKEAFGVLNEKKYVGVFQFNGSALQRIASGIVFNHMEDVVAATALARPGPMQGGATEQWIKRKSGQQRVEYWHDCFRPYLDKTQGVIVYQEQILAICREIGGMEWSEVTSVRQGMAKSKGSEYLRPFGEKFKAGCIHQGLTSHFADKLWNDIVGFGSYAFNRSHAVAYGLLSYYCCWLKAHHPLEFMAATLNFEKDDEKQILLLKELAKEGIGYVPVDPVKSTDVWSVVSDDNGSRKLIGPISGVIGMGPKMQKTIIDARYRGEPIPDRAAKLLLEAKTNIDSLTPIADAIKKINLEERNIFSQPTKLKNIVEGYVEGYMDGQGEFLVICRVEKVTKKNENSKEAIEKRQGKRVDGPAESLMLVIKDDDAQTYAKIGRENFALVGGQLLEVVKPGKSLYAIKGKIWKREDFRMILVRMIRHLGEM